MYAFAGTTDLPPVPGRIAIILGFILGTWSLVDGLLRLITGDFVRIHGKLGPWANLVGRAGLNPMDFGPVLLVMGIVWLVAANLYLFRNTVSSWKLLLIVVILSSWYVGVATLFGVAQVALLLTPATRRALRPAD